MDPEAVISMQPLKKSLLFHLAAPYAVQFAVAFLLIRGLGLPGFLFAGGWAVLLGMALIGVPFGLAHLLQAVCFAPKWPDAKTQFLIGLLNPSFAAITIVILLLLVPQCFL